MIWRLAYSVNELLKTLWSIFSTRATERMRQEGLVTRDIMVWMETSRFAGLYSRPCILRNLPRATNYTPNIMQATLEGVRKGFKQGLRYRKGGVMLLELTSASERQHDLLMPLNEAKQESVMKD